MRVNASVFYITWKNPIQARQLANAHGGYPPHIQSQ